MRWILSFLLCCSLAAVIGCDVDETTASENFHADFERNKKKVADDQRAAQKRAYEFNRRARADSQARQQQQRARAAQRQQAQRQQFQRSARR